MSGDRILGQAGGVRRGEQPQRFPLGLPWDGIAQPGMLQPVLRPQCWGQHGAVGRRGWAMRALGVVGSLLWSLLLGPGALQGFTGAPGGRQFRVLWKRDNVPLHEAREWEAAELTAGPTPGTGDSRRRSDAIMSGSFSLPAETGPHLPVVGPTLTGTRQGWLAPLSNLQT